MGVRWYALDAERNPLPSDAGAWGSMDNVVRQDWDVAGVEMVSTVFLGLDHGYGDGPPILWETLVFGPMDHPWTDYMERYTSEADAIAGHERIVAAIKAGEPCPWDPES